MSKLPGVLATGAIALAVGSLTTAAAQSSPTPLGYYRFPAIHDTTVVFTAEGDLWTVGLGGGVARRLTSGRGEESNAAISPDGSTIAFTGEYEGPGEVYTMPIAGGLPARRTWDGSVDAVVGWTPDGHVLYSTRRYSTLPILQLVSLDTATGVRTRVPLEQASDGAYDGATLFFTRFGFQGSHTRRYKGGTAQQLWKWSSAMPEAEPLTSDYAGTSKRPMPWNGRIYFASDRDGVMNIWSVDENGHDPRQLTRHTNYDLQSPSLSDGRIVYQLGADLWVLDLKTNQDRMIPIRLASDFDQMREEWVDTAMKWVSNVHLSPNGDRVVLTARGQLFVAPVKAGQGRLVEAARRPGVRYRDGKFMPSGDTLLALSDESGEVELWTMPADGVGAARQLTRDATVLRWQGVPSPNGKLIAHTDKDQRLWVYDAASGASKRIGTSEYGDFTDLAWSPDSRWLAYQATSPNGLGRIYVYDARSGSTIPATSDRYDSYSPAWSPDGKWLWLLSDRRFRSSIGSPWGPRAPEPFFDRQSEIFALALHKNERFPFAHADELHPDTSETPKKPGAHPGAAKTAEASPDSTSAIVIDTAGFMDRLYQVPVPSGNYSALNTDGTRLYFLSAERGEPRRATLNVLAITRVDPKIGTLLENITGYELSANRKKILVKRGDDLFVIDAGTHAPEKLNDDQVDLSGWKLHVEPREEWQQMYREAWRLERDYFYDRNMNGIDWPAMRKKYAPLADRVTDRAELSDVFGQMIGELSALHMFVYGGDAQKTTAQVGTASLGAELARDAKDGGYRVVHVYRNDPDDPDALAPLARAGVDVHDGDVITDVNGMPTLSGPSLGALLRNTAGTQVRLRVKTGTAGPTRDVIVEPISAGQASNLRYDEWEYTRRLLVDSLSHGRIGYVHLRAMGTNDIAQFERDFYPVYDRDALIVDVRNNGGGNIDSWILEKLMRRSWMFWQPRIGAPYWNMQDAFRGPMSVMVNEHTASDGEAFAYGFRALGLGKVIGTRTWGGEIWLSSSNVLVDRGIATAAEIGVYGPNSEWLVEGHGVDPDIVVDDTPHQTFLGRDAQLETAVKTLMDELAKQPPSVPKTPKYPHKGP
ncbi:MAG TPA: S41 family peptidase [Gemmatimonadaceae bacterium]|nr:S41 family peptidase [Gemmatimonadaceae bacterium]